MLVVESLDAGEDHRLALTRCEREEETNRALALGDLLERVSPGSPRCERSPGRELRSALEAPVAVQCRAEQISLQVGLVIERVPMLEDLEERTLGDVFSLLPASCEQNDGPE